MKQNSELRQIAWDSLSGNWGQPVIAVLIIAAIYLIGVAIVSPIVDSYPGVASCLNTIFSVLVLVPLAVAFTLQMRNFLNEDKEETIGKTVTIAKENYTRLLALSILKSIYVILWSMLLYIPGIIKSYSYAMTYYIAQDEPELSAEKCICKSMDMMKGHKMDLFLLDLSFIGWILLCILTGGIALLWVEPYYLSARAAFYEELKESQL